MHAPCARTCTRHNRRRCPSSSQSGSAASRSTRSRRATTSARVVLVCNPNNPTSTSLDLGAVAAFMERVPPHVCVILDEAYCEFALALGDTYASVELLKAHPNLVLLRTFSKVYGLAGLRAGYA